MPKSWSSTSESRLSTSRRPSPTLHATTPAQTPAPSPNRGRAHVQRENEEKSEQTQKKRRRMGNLCPGQQPTNAKHDRRGDEMRLPVLRTMLAPPAPYPERCSGRGASRAAKTWTTMTVPPAPNRRCCAVKAPTAYYHALLTTMYCRLPCTAYGR